MVGRRRGRRSDCGGVISVSTQDAVSAWSRGSGADDGRREAEQDPILRRTDGNFIFYYRSLRDGLGTTIIPGDKLPAETFSVAALTEFAREYGVQYILMEEVPNVPAKRPWLPLLMSPPDSMKLERDIRLSSFSGWNGVLHVFRFTDPSPKPKSDLALRMFMIGGTMNFKLTD